MHEAIGGAGLQAVWLEPRFTVTNLTGLPLQLAQLAQSPTAAAARRHRRGLNHLASMSHPGRQDPSQGSQPSGISSRQGSGRRVSWAL